LAAFSSYGIGLSRRYSICPLAESFSPSATASGRVWYQHSYTDSYSFDEIAGIGVRKLEDDGVSYRPVMKLRDDQNCWLANGQPTPNTNSLRKLAYLKCAEPLAAICAATGLQKLDTEGNLTDRFLPEPDYRFD
jgi:hypothetical protein